MHPPVTIRKSTCLKRFDFRVPQDMYRETHHVLPPASTNPA
jgi:hypothetical protein